MHSSFNYSYFHPGAKKVIATYICNFVVSPFLRKILDYMFYLFSSPNFIRWKMIFYDGGDTFWQWDNFCIRRVLECFISEIRLTAAQFRLRGSRSCRDAIIVVKLIIITLPLTHGIVNTQRSLSANVTQSNPLINNCFVSYLQIIGLHS